MRRISLLAGCLIVTECAAAGSLLDYLRDYDLNDYAIGVAVTGEQNPYSGSENGAYAYPYLTSFRDSVFTDDWFLIREGDLGVRWVSKSGWELGAVGRIQTLGLGNTKADDLLGIADRKWTLEVGPTIGWRGWPVHIYFKTYAEVSDRHEGLISQLALSLPMEWSRGYFVPSIELIQQTGDYVNYYYGVTAAEATPTRPAYSGDAATNLAFKARWGYALSEKWLLSGAVGLEQLDSTITNSPIVDQDNIWSARIGLAYNADLFQPRIYDDSAPRTPKFDLRVSAFQDSVSTKVARDTSAGVPGFEIDIEDFLGAPDEKTVLQVDATVRLGHYHRLEFGYFELGRNSTTTLASDLSFGDELFTAGTDVDTRVDARIFRVGYSYSLIRDAQKELGVMVGVHFLEFEADLSAGATGQAERSSAGTPLPVIGAHASIFLGEKTTIGAKVQIFRTDFDRYEGSLNFATLDVQYRIGEAFSVGLGYNYYGMKLTSSDSNVNGYLKVRHHGPAAFFTIGYQ
ncbi:MAG: MipA/OmpV family protein [Proteobacteria bacterium]|nr:MipA/OmpV family protein [Pseudomonadota bacterium]